MKMFSDTYLHWPMFDLPPSHLSWIVQCRTSEKRRDGKRRSAKAVVVVIVVVVVVVVLHLLLLVVAVFLSPSHPLLVDRSLYK